MFNISYEATLVAGQIGFSLHEETVPVVEPFAGWAMLTTQDTHLAVRKHIQVNPCLKNDEFLNNLLYIFWNDRILVLNKIGATFFFFWGDDQYEGEN